MSESGISVILFIWVYCYWIHHLLEAESVAYLYWRLMYEGLCIIHCKNGVLSLSATTQESLTASATFRRSFIVYIFFKLNVCWSRLTLEYSLIHFFWSWHVKIMLTTWFYFFLCNSYWNIRMNKLKCLPNCGYLNNSLAVWMCLSYCWCTSNTGMLDFVELLLLLILGKKLWSVLYVAIYWLKCFSL